MQRRTLIPVTAHLRIVLLVVLATAASGGCVAGPSALKISRSKFNQAIQRTEKEEMLLNLVRLRYREPVEFMDIPNVTEQFDFSGTGSIGGTLLEHGPNVLDLSLGGSAAERPTITYAPSHDEAFNQRLLSPITVQTMSLLSLTGWPIDKVLRLTVQSINEVYNARTIGTSTMEYRPDFEEFNSVAQLLRTLQERKQMELIYATLDEEPLSPPLPRSQVTGEDIFSALDKGHSFRPIGDGGRWQLWSSGRQALVLRLDPQTLDSPEVLQLVDLLNLREPRELYEIEPGAEGQLKHRLDNRLKQREELTVGRRSFLETMAYLSRAIEVPPEHMRKGLVTPTLNPDGTLFDWNEVLGDLLRIRVRKGHWRPHQAAVAVPYRGHWFYIAENDLASKTTFNLLLGLYNIAIRAGGSQNIPVLTIGVGG